MAKTEKRGEYKLLGGNVDFRKLGAAGALISRVSHNPVNEHILRNDKKEVLERLRLSAGDIDTLVNPALFTLRQSVKAAYDAKTDTMDEEAVKRAFDDALTALIPIATKGADQHPVGNLGFHSGYIISEAARLAAIEVALVFHEQVPEKTAGQGKAV